MCCLNCQNGSSIKIESKTIENGDRDNFGLRYETKLCTNCKGKYYVRISKKNCTSKTPIDLTCLHHVFAIQSSKQESSEVKTLSLKCKVCGAKFSAHQEIISFEEYHNTSCVS